MLLDRSQRQMVVFNPANKEHRNHYAEFLKNKSWGNVLFGLKQMRVMLQTTTLPTQCNAC